MLKALVIKELRESAGLLAIAAVALLLAGLDILGWNRAGSPDFSELRDRFPFISDDFFSPFVIIMGGLALVLGFKQSVWELWQNTYPFLLHRPASRWFLFGSKLLVGSGLLLGIGGLAIVAYALWVAVPGISPTPFFWSMTADEWLVLPCCVLAYLGAFLSGIRPGRWFGTRLAPAVTAGCVAFLCSLFPWQVTLVPLAVAIGVFLGCIHYYTQARDY
jgi:hypothetical protein